jgi:exodeoxyribonuclease X
VRLRVLDCETTGLDPRTPRNGGDAAEICELAFIDVDERGTELDRFQTLVKPFNKIPPQSRAIHHIGPDDLVDAPRWVQTIFHLRFKPLPDILVAHNSTFERQFLSDLWPGVPWLCTIKAAMRVWPSSPAFSNSVLRYHLGVDITPDATMPAHRALCDCLITSRILKKLQEHGATLDEMITWEGEPAMLPKMPFGRHRNLAWTDIPFDYLSWIVETITDKPSVTICAQKEIERRAAQASANRGEVANV